MARRGMVKIRGGMTLYEYVEYEYQVDTDLVERRRAGEVSTPSPGR